jgi:hypothetical protein
MDARAEKRTTTSASILDNPSILRQIFAWVGPGNYLFLSTICSRWHHVQLNLPDFRINNLIGHQFGAPQIHCTWQSTFYSAAFATRAFLTTAHEAGLPLQRFTEDGQDDRLQFIAGRTADLDTLQLAHALGLELKMQSCMGLQSRPPF